MKAAIYARCCSRQRCENALKNQINSCIRYAMLKKIAVDKNQVYTDAATSGLQFHRAGLDNLMKSAREKLFDVLIVNDFSRLSRDIVHLSMLIEELSDYGIILHSVEFGKKNSEGLLIGSLIYPRSALRVNKNVLEFLDLTARIRAEEYVEYRSNTEKKD